MRQFLNALFAIARCAKQSGRLSGLVLGSLVALALWLPQTAYAEGRRVALVIGISQYQSVPSLANPGRDAARVAQALRQVGFEVVELTQPKQLGRAELSLAITTFKRTAVGADAAVIYYAGHGVEVGGRNFLLPADVRAETPDELDVTAIPSSFAISAVSGARTVRLVILDACRDNPFANEPGWGTGQRSITGSRGLAREVNLPPNVMLLLATQPGTKANDGNGAANSPFAQALAASLTTQGMRLASLPSSISKQMRLLSGIDQRPDQQGIIDEPDWPFAAGASVNPVANPSPANRPQTLALVQPIAQPAPAPAPQVSVPTPTAQGFGLILQGQTTGRGVYVGQVGATSPFFEKVYVGDVILKLNGAIVADPAGVISALEQDGRASVVIQRNGQPIMKTLEIEKSIDE